MAALKRMYGAVGDWIVRGPELRGVPTADWRARAVLGGQLRSQ